LGRRTLEGSRAAVSLFLHAALHIIGCQGYEYLIDKSIRETQYMARLIKSRPEFELLVEPEMNILLYRYIPAHLRSKAERGELTASDNEVIGQANKEIQRIQRRAGKSFVSRTTINMTNGDDLLPVIALRVVIANPGTTEEDIASVLKEQAVIGNGLTALTEPS
jgi:glutamate decarboxylase